MSTVVRAASKRLRGLLLVLGCFLIFASAASRGVAAPTATDLRAAVFLAATDVGTSHAAQMGARYFRAYGKRMLARVSRVSAAGNHSAGENQWNRD